MPRKKTMTKAKPKPRTKAKAKPKPKPKSVPKPTRKKAVYANAVTKLTTAQAKRMVGGKFPDIKGQTHSYPPCTNEKAWTLLVNRAHAMKQRDRKALKEGKKTVPYCKLRSKYNYLLFHSQPRQKWKRGKRNEHRKKNGLQKGDGLIVHHKNQKTMGLGSTVVMTHCEHLEEHGARCK